MPTIKRGDTLPRLRFQCLADGQPVDLTGWQARYLIQDRRTGELVVDTAATVDDAAAGIVSYQPDPDELPIGYYRMEIETSDGTDRATYPQDGYESLVVIADLG